MRFCEENDNFQNHAEFQNYVSFHDIQIFHASGCTAKSLEFGLHLI